MEYKYRVTKLLRMLSLWLQRAGSSLVAVCGSSLQGLLLLQGTGSEVVAQELSPPHHMGLSQTRDHLVSPASADGFSSTEPSGEAGL